MPEDKRQRAIVIGGSMAGLLAGRVLADHYRQVTIIERDALPDSPVFRNGVPQAHHQHILLLKGKSIIEGYLPGFEQQLLAHGAVRANIDDEFMTITSFGRIAPARTGLHILLCSRYLTEWCVRDRLSAYPNIHILPHAEATGLQTEQGKDRVSGIRLRGRGGESVPAELEADLVVDCSGRGSSASQWLAGMGYPAPETTVVNSHLGYATRWYRQSEQGLPWKGVLMWVKAPHNPRAGALLSVEGGQWIVTLAGIAGNYPPTDEAGFLDFARQLTDPLIYNAISQAEPVSQIYGYRRTENRWQHFERLGAWPGGFAVMGDAACCFNPVYGQGMTAAAMGSTELDSLLHASTGDFTGQLGLAFQSRLVKALQTPWLMATGEDFRWQDTEGERPGPVARLSQKYFDRVLKLANRDWHASQAFIQVVHLLQPPTSLLHPRILLPALLQNWGEE